MNDQYKEFLNHMGVNYKNIDINNILKADKNKEKKDIKINRNDRCKCGSNKKYKKCCGK